MNTSWSARCWIASSVLMLWALGAYSGYRARCISTNLFASVHDENGRDLGLICAQLQITLGDGSFTPFGTLGHSMRQALRSLDRLRWSEDMSSRDSFHLVIDSQRPNLLAAVGSELHVGVDLLLEGREFESAMTEMLRILGSARSKRESKLNGAF